MRRDIWGRRWTRREAGRAEQGGEVLGILDKSPARRGTKVREREARRGEERAEGGERREG